MSEFHHGKMRPSLPRSSDLPAITPAGDDRRRHRDSGGRFTVGNPGGLGRGAIAPLRRLLGGVVITDPEARMVAADASRVFVALIATMPDDSAPVRQLGALLARHTALAGLWSAKASAAGLGSEEGLEAESRATSHGQRVERLTVTILDVATRLAANKPKAPFDPLAQYRAKNSQKPAIAQDQFTPENSK